MLSNKPALSAFNPPTRKYPEARAPEVSMRKDGVSVKNACKSRNANIELKTRNGYFCYDARVCVGFSTDVYTNNTQSTAG